MFAVLVCAMIDCLEVLLQKIYCGGDELSDDVTVDAAGLFSKSVDFLEISE